MESIKALLRRPLEFLISLISPSQTIVDEPLPPVNLTAEEQTSPTSLDRLNLPPRVFNCLWKADIRSLETVVSMSDQSLLDIRGFGAKALTELKQSLATYDIFDIHPDPVTREVETQPNSQ